MPRRGLLRQLRFPTSDRLANGLLLVAGVAVGLALGEAVVRVTGATDDGPTGYAPVKTRGRWGGPENSQGYRDEERDFEKPAGVRRVVVLGDSFTWGVGVEYDDTWPRRLERLLARRRRGERWEVVSLARPGMNTVEEAAQLAAEGIAYEPDAVVLGYCLNDSEDEDAAEVRRARDWEGQRAARQRGEVSLAERSALYRFVSARLRATAETRARVSNYETQYEDGYPGWRAGRRALASMGTLCRQHRVPLLVAVFPLFGNPLDDRYPFANVHAAVDRAVADAGGAAVDLLPAFRGLRWELLVVDGARDEHPNEVAHRIASDAIVAALLGVLPASPAPPAPPASSAPPQREPVAPERRRLADRLAAADSARGHRSSRRAH